MKSNFLKTLDIRVAYEKAVINGDLLTIEESEIEAHIVGAAAQFARESQVPPLFKNVPQLLDAWHDGWEASTRNAHWREHDAESESLGVVEEIVVHDWAEIDEDISHIPQELWDAYPFGSDLSESDCHDDDVPA
uniref:hypothetical protein n=1 Tax=Pseudomonas syringae TaxID=317 RepID=UPI001E562052|nr:hypothetical protein [Pseudomonas syringae]QOQ33302.1 hypothetical protein [Pseudomonas syringae pv. actinidiae]